MSRHLGPDSKLARKVGGRSHRDVPRIWYIIFSRFFNFSTAYATERVAGREVSSSLLSEDKVTSNGAGRLANVSVKITSFGFKITRMEPKRSWRSGF